MEIVSSLLMIVGITGLVSFMVFITLRPGLLSRTAVTVIIIIFFSLACVGLVLLTLVGGVTSLHTGG